jgi:hypothetical protein
MPHGISCIFVIFEPDRQKIYFLLIKTFSGPPRKYGSEIKNIQEIPCGIRVAFVWHSSGIRVAFVWHSRGTQFWQICASLLTPPHAGQEIDDLT